ncbi:hypothetical protein AVEN_40412-1 [Araneus ventricosus]|uniref:Uncharacterized protein n=1 Tax=Araneus ventricosus TaxID=182803 RepID=A0A4Y2D9M0_ARAVE|nr:hypothetical protein AVEN_40412-1 [Araneus ventricosus]
MLMADCATNLNLKHALLYIESTVLFEYRTTETWINRKSFDSNSEPPGLIKECSGFEECAKKTFKTGWNVMPLNPAIKFWPTVKSLQCHRRPRRRGRA